MDKAVKERWLNALESGNFPKDRGWLRTLEGYCCLGVLAETEKLPGWNGTSFRNDDDLGNSYSYIPDELAEKYGLDVNTQRELGEINDNSDGFKRVIKYIKENL